MNSPISIRAINANIVAGVTPTGKAKYSIEKNENAGIAVDRVQACNDYFLSQPEVSYKLLPNGVFKSESGEYITYSLQPLEDDLTCLLTCRCQQSGLSHDQALGWLKRGMEECFMKYKELLTR